MNKTVISVLLLFSVLLTQAAEQSSKPGIEAVAWLAGQWQFEKDGRVVREEWMAPAGGTMLGMSRTVKGDSTIDYEHIFLGLDKNGHLIYVSAPARQARTTFTLLKLEGRAVVFENLAHDFPQRVGYTLNGDGSLTAFIEGTVKGKFRRVEFPYQPAK